MKEAIKLLEFAIINEERKIWHWKDIIKNDSEIVSLSQVKFREEKIITCEARIKEYILAIKHLHNVSQS